MKKLLDTQTLRVFRSYPLLLHWDHIYFHELFCPYKVQDMVQMRTLFIPFLSPCPEIISMFPTNVTRKFNIGAWLRYAMKYFNYLGLLLFTANGFFESFHDHQYHRPYFKSEKQQSLKIVDIIWNDIRKKWGNHYLELLCLLNEIWVTFASHRKCIPWGMSHAAWNGVAHWHNLTFWNNLLPFDRFGCFLVPFQFYFAELTREMENTLEFSGPPYGQFLETWKTLFDFDSNPLTYNYFNIRDILMNSPEKSSETKLIFYTGKRFHCT